MSTEAQIEALGKALSKQIDMFGASLGKSIDVLRDDVRTIGEQTQTNCESIAVCVTETDNNKISISGHIKNHENEKDRQLKKIALITTVISTLISAGAYFLSLFSDKS